MFRIHRFAKALIEELKNNPQKWTEDEFYLIHESGTKIWIANGKSFIRANRFSFNLRSKFALWKAYGEWLVDDFNIATKEEDLE